MIFAVRWMSVAFSRTVEKAKGAGLYSTKDAGASCSGRIAKKTVSGECGIYDFLGDQTGGVVDTIVAIAIIVLIVGPALAILSDKIQALMQRMIDYIATQ